MPSVLPVGDPAPVDGLLPAQAAAGAEDRAFCLYVHIPFCRVRCGYCDFNTYTAKELGSGASQDEYSGTLNTELELAARVLRGSGVPERPLSTVFFGGGTPTLLPAADLASMLRRAAGLWGLEPGAEVTTEANPDSVTPQSLEILAEAGFTRVSFGMQSAVPHVLQVLDRTHDPERVPQAVQWARDAGLNVSLDLIYGTPGESIEDWEASLDSAIGCTPDHISAYALIVEDAPSSPRRSAAAKCPVSTTTTMPPSMRSPTRGSARQASAGTRSATGPALPRTAAATTWPTGAATTGGERVRAHIRTWVASGGGT